MGTAPYLSPEQIAGEPADARSDQYTLGVILYECATGQRPHAGDALFAVMRNIADGKFRPPRALRADLPVDLEALILRTMSRAPGDRFASVHALGRALLPFASPKRRVLWSDYFERDPAAADASSRTAAAWPPVAPVVPTRLLDVPTPEALPPTRTRPEPAPSTSVDASPEIGSGGVVEAEDEPRPTRRRLPIPVIIAAGVIIALAIWFIARRPSPPEPLVPGHTAAPPPAVAPMAAPPAAVPPTGPGPTTPPAVALPEPESVPTPASAATETPAAKEPKKPPGPRGTSRGRTDGAKVPIIE